MDWSLVITSLGMGGGERGGGEKEDFECHAKNLSDPKKAS